MIDIKKKLVALLRDDATLKAILGSTPEDPRVYAYYQPNAIIDGTRKAYITYATTAFPSTVNWAVAEPVFTLAIWGLNGDTTEAVRDRLVALFDEKRLTTATGRVIHGTRLGEHDAFQENTKFFGKNMQFRFGFSKV